MHSSRKRKPAAAGKGGGDNVKSQRPPSSKFRGVSWHKRDRKWQVRVRRRHLRRSAALILGWRACARAGRDARAERGVLAGARGRTNARAAAAFRRSYSPPPDPPRSTRPLHPPARPALPYLPPLYNPPSIPPQAELQFSGKRHHLGTWASEVDAARAYDRAAREHVPKGKAIFNFPHSTAAPAAPRATVGSASRRKRQRRADAPRAGGAPVANDADAALQAAHRLHSLASLSTLPPHIAAPGAPFRDGDGGTSPRYGGGARPRSMSAGRYPGSFWGTERQSAMLIAEQESMVQRQRLWQQQQALLQQAHFQQMLMAQRAFAAAAAATLRPHAGAKPVIADAAPAAPPTGAETTPRSSEVARSRAVSLGSASAVETPSVSVAAMASSAGAAPVKVQVSVGTQAGATQPSTSQVVTPPCTPSAAAATKAVTDTVDEAQASAPTMEA